MGRAQAYKHATGEPHIWESEEDWPDGPSGEEVARYANNRELPPLPPTSGKPIRFNQGTVRHVPVAAAENAGKQRPIERERSGGYDDYEGPYSAKVDGLQHQMEGAQLDDELADTTLLDSVVLPAIASVNKLCL